jgi:hypothetical protein
MMAALIPPFAPPVFSAVSFAKLIFCEPRGWPKFGHPAGRTASSAGQVVCLRSLSVGLQWLAPIQYRSSHIARVVDHVVEAPITWQLTLSGGYFFLVANLHPSCLDALYGRCSGLLHVETALHVFLHQVL